MICKKTISKSVIIATFKKVLDPVLKHGEVRTDYTLYNPMSLQNATPAVKRFLLWAVVAAYLAALPEAIVVYRQMAANFPARFMSSMPVLISVCLLFVYLLMTLKSRNQPGVYLSLVPCILIFVIVRSYQPCNNKLIHVPEYVLLTWLVYIAMSPDYDGKEMLLVVFVFSSLLGVVDEIIQGIHPGRFYGGKDMITNSLAALIGVLTIRGLKDFDGPGIALSHIFKEKKGTFLNIFFGFIGSALVIYYLFKVKNGEPSLSFYPAWLVAWNLFFIFMAIVTIVLDVIKGRESLSIPENTGSSDSIAQASFVRLLTCSLLVALAIIHALAAIVVITGYPFR